MLVDVETGEVLQHEEAFKRWYPASLTKLMTAYVAFRAIESGDLEITSPVTLSAKAAAEPPSKMYYGEGATMTLDTALKIIMVKSANDVAAAIGESVAGNRRDFIERMNSEARRLGMSDTHFINPHGLPGEGQYTTARDMAVLARALKRDFPQYGSYFSIEAIETGDNIYPNYNMLIGRYPGADGMKTGFICSAGFNQVSSAHRGDRSVISVVFGAESLADRAEQSARLLEEGLSGEATGSGVKLMDLEPYGENRTVVADLREEICSPEAAQTRAEGRDDDGDLILNSKYILPLERELEPVAVALGGTDGRVAAIEVDMPIPTPRPRLVELEESPEVSETAELVASETETTTVSTTDGLRPSLDVPLPSPRPSL
ncbi:D-alanyl-D-alanine carboxypeptidase family protein [Pararhizobium haloflavum]|uniref:D-alanyl-D-alanine carboxypeptidase family protein n=1 Tax=Pararhizobium haloflavum TaxID=2037914 RepID=UPI000C18175E|nr:D-alanyl-D-alanine carboxypeptidase family protein [Pararhizobium haloflavum]